MSGRATLTTVTSSNSMNVAIETRTRVHHLRSMAGDPKEPPPSAELHQLSIQQIDNLMQLEEVQRLDRQVAELLADALVEARAGELGEAADAVGETDLQGRS